MRGSGPIASISSSLIPDVMNDANAPSPSGMPSAAYFAPASSRAESTSRCSTGSTSCSAAIASTTSLRARKAVLSAAAMRHQRYAPSDREHIGRWI